MRISALLLYRRISARILSLVELTVIQVSLRGYLKSIFAVVPAGCLESNRNARAGTGDHPCDAIGYESVRVRARLNAAEVSVEFSTEAQNLRHVIDTRLELVGASLPGRLGRHAYNCAVGC
jgi:hypothetical protein